MKNVVLIVSGTGGQGFHEVELHEGITAGDTLRAALGELGDQYLLSLEGSGQRFAAEELIYDRVPEGGKLRATAITEVGSPRTMEWERKSG